MPATGGGRAVHQPSSKRNEKSRSVEAMHAPQLESPRGSVSATAQRPGLKERAYSTPIVPKDQENRADDDNASLYDQEADGIADDAFFQRYHFPQPVDPTTQEEASDSSRDSSSDTEGPLSPTHTQARQPAGAVPAEPSSSSGNNAPTPTMLDINVAVIGASSTGKSCFIRRALGLPENTPHTMCHRKWTLEGTPYVVRMFELQFEDIHVSDRGQLEWPKTIHEMTIPRVDGAITIYDVTNEKSLAKVPEMLKILSTTQIPSTLLACKCDQHPAHREVDPSVVEQKAKSFLGEIRVFQSSQASPDTQRECLTFIIRAVVAARRPRSQASSARQRANSSAVRPIHKDIWGKHGRASSEISVRFPHGSSDAKGHRYKPSDANKTFFNAEESPGYDSQESDDQDSDTGRSINSVKPSDENGYTFDQLVDRLLAQPMSKNDTKFVAIFLAFYRRFGTPGQLMEAILKRFEASSREKEIPLIRIIAQLRYLAVLQLWVANYPGDFAYPTTRRLIRRFASALASNREYSAAATEIIRDLEWVAEDDDTDWACSDRQRAQNDHLPTFHHNVLDEDSDEDELSRNLGHMSASDRMSIARNSVLTSGSRATNSTGGSMGSSQALLSQVERNERLARQLEPNPIKSITKVQWHQLMTETDEAIAKELTRIDWIMFSSVRPRDLVRHVSMNAEEKKKCKNLENVTRMTDHFNHVAFIVTNYILMRDKPKHRALMLEKWMRIARQLRKLNNYNSLGAVIAGIKGSAVHRLIATRDLVPQAITHDFLKLDILMGPAKSHFSYRLAWENTSGERIPYIPLHRRDLVSASEGNSTFVGDKKKTDSTLAPHPGVNVFQAAAGNRDSKEAPPGGVTGKERINWRKFEIMGEVIVGVQRAQGTPYPNWPKCEEVRNLVLDVKISKDEDELYERSTHLEAPGANEKGRFAKWLARA